MASMHWLNFFSSEVGTNMSSLASIGTKLLNLYELHSTNEVKSLIDESDSRSSGTCLLITILSLGSVIGLGISG